MKKNITFLGLLILSSVAGLLVQNFCYRFPSEGEMKYFHEAKQSTKVSLIESREVVKDGVEKIHFRVQHTNNSGFTEFYNIEAPKRWVMPWENYRWMQSK